MPAIAKTRQISEFAEQQLSRAECNGNSLLLKGQLTPKEYKEVNTVIEGLGGKWNKKLKVHVFPGDAAAVISDALGAGEFVSLTDEKKVWSFWPTPPEVCEQLCELAEIDEESMVLEPSAGEGHLVKAIQQRTKKVSAVELSTSRSLLLMQLKLTILATGDFLRMTRRDVGVFDAVVMNPPFNTPGLANAWIDHVEHACKFAPRVVSVVPSGIHFREDRKHTEFQSFLSSQRFWETIPLEDGAFKDSGTGVNCCLLRIDVADR